MKKIVLSLMALLPLSLWAQNEPTKDWSFRGVAGLNISQTSLTNWAAGGENNMSGNVYLNANVDYQKGKWTWNNAFVTDFGQSYSKSLNWQTTIDKLNLSSKVGYSFAKHLNVSALGDFLTQYSPGYKNAKAKNNGDPCISNFMAPAYLNIAVGVDYRPNNDLSLLVAPITGKTTFVLDKMLSNNGAYGVNPGKKIFAELGASLVANYNKELIKDLTFGTKLYLFTAYTHNFGNIDVIWDTMLSLKINKYITATLTTNLLYDDDIKTPNAMGKLTKGAKVQFREILGIGFAYNF